MPILYVGYSITGRMPDEEYLKRIFQKYGKVIFVKCCRSDRTQGLRSYAFVEFDILESAKYARKKMFINDHYGDRRRKIGDAKLEISILVKKKKKLKK